MPDFLTTLLIASLIGILFGLFMRQTNRRV